MLQNRALGLATYWNGPWMFACSLCAPARCPDFRVLSLELSCMSTSCPGLKGLNPNLALHVLDGTESQAVSLIPW